jgi:hypothetical protein
MIDENIKEFMNNIEIKTKQIAIYSNKEKGLVYPLSLATLLTRVDYLELTKQELDKALFENKVDKGDYKMYDCERLVPKYEITKIEADKYVITSKKIKATHIWNVSNQAGIHQSFESQDEAFTLCEEINNKILEYMKD